MNIYQENKKYKKMAKCSAYKFMDDILKGPGTGVEKNKAIKEILSSPLFKALS